MKQDKGKAIYNLHREHPTLFLKIVPWVQKVCTGSADDVHFFSCKVCKTGKISLSNMGIGTVHSHMKDPSSEKLSKHSKDMEVLSSIKKDAFTRLAIPKDVPKSATSKKNSRSSECCLSSSCSTSHSNSGISKTTIQTALKPLSEQVVISKIRWAMYVVYHHYNLCSSGGMAALFQEMFSDSQVAQEFSLSWAKLSYFWYTWVR